MRRKTVKSQQLLHIARKRQERPPYVAIRVPLEKQNACLPCSTLPPFPPKEEPESKGNENSKTPFSHYGRHTRSNKKRIKQ